MTAHLLVEWLSILSRVHTNVRPEIPALFYSYELDSQVREISCKTEIFSCSIFSSFIKKMNIKVKG
jgi:hypothetical protein